MIQIFIELEFPPKIAGKMYFLSQWGQYSSVSSKSLQENQIKSQKNYAAFFLKTFLQDLHAKTSSIVFNSGWSVVSVWHSGQSNHFLQHAVLIDTFV